MALGNGKSLAIGFVGNPNPWAAPSITTHAQITITITSEPRPPRYAAVGCGLGLTLTPYCRPQSWHLACFMKKYGFGIAGFEQFGQSRLVRRRLIRSHTTYQAKRTPIMKPNEGSPTSAWYVRTTVMPAKGHPSHHKKKWFRRRRTSAQKSLSVIACISAAPRRLPRLSPHVPEPERPGHHRRIEIGARRVRERR